MIKTHKYIPFFSRPIIPPALIFVIWLCPLSQQAQSLNPSIALVSDTQAPMWIESVFLKSNNNRKATEMIFRELSARKPGVLFILGDVVAAGSSDKHWGLMDPHLDLLRKQGIPVHALLGNHDVMYSARSGEPKFQQRFPDHRRLGQRWIVDSLAIIMLNSNFSTLSEQDAIKQSNWLKQELTGLDNDPSICMVIVSCHHAPYTNSKIVGMDETVQKVFVPPFVASRKARLFITGHAHAFERFEAFGKDFMTIGGGGGIHQPLKSGKESLPDKASHYKPMFHFLTMARTPTQLELTSWALRNDFSGFDQGYTFSISYRP